MLAENMLLDGECEKTEFEKLYNEYKNEAYYIAYKILDDSALAECVVITLPAYAVGAGLNILVTNKVMCRVLDHFKQAYSLKTYLCLFAGFMFVFIIIVIPMISLSVGRKINYKQKG